MGTVPTCDCQEIFVMEVVSPFNDTTTGCVLGRCCQIHSFSGRFDYLYWLKRIWFVTG